LVIVFRGLGGGLKALQRLPPERVEVFAQRCDCLRIDLIDTTRTRRSIENEAHLLEHLEMLGHGGTAYRELLRELADRERSPAQPFEDLTSGGISQRL
jgi:hypothetical protein